METSISFPFAHHLGELHSNAGRAAHPSWQAVSVDAEALKTAACSHTESKHSSLQALEAVDSASVIVTITSFCLHSRAFFYGRNNQRHPGLEDKLN